MQSCTVCTGIADHLAILCSTSILSPGHCSRIASKPPMTKFNFSRIEELRVNIAEKLPTLNSINDPEQSCDILILTIQQEVNKLSSPSVHRRTTPIQPWVTSAILRSINTREKLLKKFLQNRSVENETKFKKFRNVLRLTLRLAKKRYFQNQFEKNTNNPRLLWENLLKAIQKPKVRQNISPRFEVDGDFLTEDKPIADSFNSYYSNVARNLEAALGPSNTDPLSYLSNVQPGETMIFTPVTEHDVFAIVSNLKDSGAGSDGISAKLLKLILPTILLHLTRIINLCISNATFPSVFKEAVITPVFKGGQKTLFSSYRPISVLPALSKILETIMYNQLVTFITRNNILTNCQFGFRTNHSTYMPISILHDFITNNLISGHKTAGIFLDLARAFDTVNFNILLHKLDKYGISGNANHLLSSYLKNRKQRVKFNGTVSSTKNVTCGVPQGSILGPLLFLLYINDLDKACSVSKCLIFADDTAVFYSASSMTELQSIIDESFPKILSWLHANRLSLSIRKTSYQVYTSSKEDNDLLIKVGNEKLNRSYTVKYLGVLIDENLKFKSHINKISGIVSRHTGILGRARYLLNKKLLVMLYNALILPHLSYCLCVWGSNYDTTLYPVVIAQKRAIRVIAGVPALTHSSPLFKDLQILKLSDLVQYQLMSILHDFLKEKLPRVISDKFELHTPDRPTRVSKHFSERNVTETGQVIPNYKMHSYRKFTLFCRAPSVWNNIVSKNIPNIHDVPRSKSFFKKVVRKLFIDSY